MSVALGGQWAEARSCRGRGAARCTALPPTPQTPDGSLCYWSELAAFTTLNPGGLPLPLQFMGVWMAGVDLPAGEDSLVGASAALRFSAE